MINTRLNSHQLSIPTFNTPKDLVNWMGALQGQDFTMSRWAIGVRLKDGKLKDIDDAFSRGEIVRTHILRPTWHIVSAEDIRWMLNLTAPRLLAAFTSWERNFPLNSEIYTKGLDVVAKALEGKKMLTKEELGKELKRENLLTDDTVLTRILHRAELTGLVCGGAIKNKKHSYLLLDEFISKTNDLTKDESLALLAKKYFRSHSPATIDDFTWWSGLTKTDAKKGIQFIESELIKENDTYIHESCCRNECDGILRFLPPYDEYLISYKDRTSVLPKEYEPKAYTKYGIFYPVILYNGKIVGNWKKSNNKKESKIDISLFDNKQKISKQLIKKSTERYFNFIN